MTSLFDISGKKALITGGSKGIGRMIAEGFLKAGAKVYITARNAEDCNKAVKELSEIGDITALPHDISNMEGIEALVSDYARHETELDILINNAGAWSIGAFDQFTEENWDSVMDLNVKSLFFLTQKLASFLRTPASSESPSRVINIASVGGMTLPDMETYSYITSKAAVIHLTRRMAARLIEDNINVNCISPGAFPSAMNFVAREHPELITGRIPNKRVGNADDIAGTCIYLSSKAGSYLIGHNIPVDGGMVFGSCRGDK